MAIFEEIRRSSEFAALLETSARLGNDPLQVQGPGGNVSIKRDGAMWVKASGTWLAEATSRDIMVPVDSAALREAFRSNDPRAENASEFVPADLETSGLRGSIETTVHAALDWPIVLHTHCVATIAVAIRPDAEDVLKSALPEISWCFVPYVKPGADLARAISSQTTRETRVIVLGNHGLVVCGETVDKTETLLRDVSEALTPPDLAPSLPMAEGFEARLAGSGWMPAPDPLTHAIARDSARLALARGATLYPDHLIFLGPGVSIAESGEETADSLTRSLEGGPPRKLVLSPDQGAAIPADATPAMLAMARCLGDVLARVPPDTKLSRLTETQEHALLNWDAEKHRQSLNKVPET